MDRLLPVKVNPAAQTWSVGLKLGFKSTLPEQRFERISSVLASALLG
jgi:hypothetical protein